MAAKKHLARAKLFRNGRSQAVRLPKEFRFPGDEVTLRRDGNAVIMEPVRKRAWPRGYWTRLAQSRGVGAHARPMRVTLQEVDADDP
jgi:antitoxin VapB